MGHILDSLRVREQNHLEHLRTFYRQVGVICGRHAFRKDEHETPLEAEIWEKLLSQFTGGSPLAEVEYRYLCATVGCPSLEIAKLQCTRCQRSSYCDEWCQRK